MSKVGIETGVGVGVGEAEVELGLTVGLTVGLADDFTEALGVEVATGEGETRALGAGVGEGDVEADGLNMVLKYTTPIKAATITTIKKPIRAGIMGSLGFDGTYTGRGSTGGIDVGETG